MATQATLAFSGLTFRNTASLRLTAAAFSPNEILRPLMEGQSGALARELQSLSRETDPELFFSGLLQLGHRQQQQGRIQNAAAIYSSIASEGRRGAPSEVPAAIRERAQRSLNAINGVGDSGPRFEFLLGRVLEEATRPDMLLAMGAAGAAFRLARLGTAMRLAGPVHAALHGRPAALLLGGASNAAGWLTESLVFTGTARLVGAAVGHRQDWSGGALFQEWGSSASMLLGLRVMGRIPQALANGSAGVRALAQPASQAGMFGGIVLGNRLAELGGFHPTRQGDTWLVDGLSTLLQFNIAARLQHAAFGPGLSRFERRLDFQTEALWTSPSRALPHRVMPHVLLAESVPPGLDPNLIPPATASGTRLSDRSSSPVNENSPNSARSNETTGEFAAFSAPEMNQLPAALFELNRIADQQLAIKALGLVYLGSQGPIRPLLFEALQSLEMGRDSGPIVQDLLAQSQLNHSRFSSAEVETAIFYGLRRLQAGEDVEVLDFVYNGKQYGPGLPVPTPFRMSHLTTEEQVVSNRRTLEQTSSVAKRPPSHWPMSAILANAENNALAKAFEADGQRIRRASELDPLTGVLNRQGLARMTPRLEKRSVSFQRSGDQDRKADWILVIDVDHFKKVNESFTHPGADVVLHDIAQIMDRSVRRYNGDLVFRFGGDEFVIFLAGSGPRGAQKVAEKIRSAIEANTSTLHNGREARVTVSVAAAEMKPLPSATPGEWVGEGSLEAVISRASGLMLQGKQAGQRNRVFME